MKKVALVGSTGSIGKQVINVVERYPEKFKLTALIAGGNARLLEEQIARVHPDFAALADSEAFKSLARTEDTVYFCGKEGALKALEESGADVVFVACGGFAGLEYTLKALELNATVALANKESLVCGGELLSSAIDKIVPVDSEHSAIWQCLNFDRKHEFSRLYITASGGAFRGKKQEELKTVTAAQALNHPTWKMGAKITVDSATLLNKGYEVMEAHYLYNAPYNKITAVLHPQSVIHSMVQFADGAIMAQLSRPTMELPIQLALTYPERFPLGLEELDFAKPFSLDFEPLKREDYPLFSLALDCGMRGGVLPTVLNAASEIADYAFLQGRIGFTDIFKVAERAVSATDNRKATSFAQLKEADQAARRLANKIIGEV